MLRNAEEKTKNLVNLVKLIRKSQRYMHLPLEPKAHHCSISFFSPHKLALITSEGTIRKVQEVWDTNALGQKLTAEIFYSNSCHLKGHFL